MKRQRGQTKRQRDRRQGDRETHRQIEGNREIRQWRQRDRDTLKQGNKRIWKQEDKEQGDRKTKGQGEREILRDKEASGQRDVAHLRPQGTP